MCQKAVGLGIGICRIPHETDESGTKHILGGPSAGLYPDMPGGHKNASGPVSISLKTGRHKFITF